MPLAIGKLCCLARLLCLCKQGYVLICSVQAAHAFSAYAGHVCYSLAMQDNHMTCMGIGLLLATTGGPCCDGTKA